MKIISNHEIKNPKVFVIAADGNKVGELATREAIEMAKRENKDLVIIGMNKGMPTAKIVEKGKYLYEQKKREKDRKKKSKAMEVKEVRLSPNIAQQDLLTKEKSMRKFLEAGHEVKVTLVCRGREIGKIRTLMGMLDAVSEDLKDCSEVKTRAKAEGRRASAILKPKG